MDITRLRQRVGNTCLMMILITTSAIGHSEQPNNESSYQTLCETTENLKNDILCDFSVYLGKENLRDLGVLFLTIGTMANTNIDHALSRSWKKGIHSSSSDTLFKLPDRIGKCNYVATYLGTMAIGHWQSHTTIGYTLYNWGYRSIRTLLLVGVQDPIYGWFIGNGRPKDGKHTSRWKLFKKGGEAGCSGHSFNGAIPFMTAAMMTDSLPLKIGFYTLASLPGFARINKQAHYPSQVILSWGIAYLAARSVCFSEEAQELCHFRTNIVRTKEGGGIQACWQF